jgi:hypothetical protein
VNIDVPFVADTVTMSPVSAPGIVISGVASSVMLSEFDRPVSDDGSRSGAGRDGGVVAIMTVNEDNAGDTLPSGSVSVEEIFHVPSVSVGSVQFVAVPMT